MLETELSPQPHHRHPVLNLFLTIILVGISFVFVGPFIGIFLASPFFEGDMDSLFKAIQNPTAYPDVKIPLYIIQGSATFFGLIVAPALLLARTKTPVLSFFSNQKFDFVPILVTSFVVIAFMGVNSIFIEWNSNLQFPKFLEDLETRARAYEQAAEQLTKFLTNFSSQKELWIAMFVIAVLPAVGEELVFRGLIQNDLYRTTNNMHVAIWLSAILFSAMHMQFFGFVPRMLLGALFGYLYYWSGNLTLAILAHFVNNGASVMAMYFYQQGTLNFDLESTESVPANMVIISALLTGGLLYYFFRYFQDHKPTLPQA